MITALSGTSSGGTTMSSRNESVSHGFEEDRHAFGHVGRHVDVGGHEAADEHIGLGGLLDRREDVGA